MPPAKNDIHTEFEQLSPKEYRCRYCAAPQKTADIVRLMRHIIICPCAPVNSKHSAGQLSREHAHSIENRKCRQVSTYHESSQTSLSLESCSSFCTQADLHHWIDTVTPNENKELNQQLADLIFSVGLPFSLVEHPKFIAFLHRLRPSYKAAHRTLLATRLLDNAYKDLRVQFDAQVIASPHGNARLTLISDGWTNIRGESIINYMLVRPDGAAYFHSSEPAGLSLHTGEFLAQQMTAVINDVGPHHINAICCDSAANQQNAVKRVQHRFPSIIGIKYTLHKAVKLAKWFRNHQFVHEALKIQQKVFYKKEIALSLPVPTRWQSNLDCVMALINSQKAFESVVLIDTVETAMSKAGPKHHKARNAMSLIKSQDFWKCLKSMADVIRPFVQLIISFESNVPKLSTLYGSYLWLFKTAIELIPVEHRITVRDLLRARWSKMKSIEMEMASLLDVCLDAKYVVTLLDGRAGILGQWLIERYGEVVGGQLYAKLLQFLNKQGRWALPFYWTLAARSIGPINWWQQQFADTALCRVALDVLSIAPSSGAAERNWSTFGYIHSKSRNRLCNEKVEKLVFIYTNANLLAKTDYREMWFNDLEVSGVDEVVGADGIVLDVFEDEESDFEDQEDD